MIQIDGGDTSFGTGRGARTFSRFVVQVLGLLLVVFGVVTPCVAAEPYGPISALDLISNDVALCLEIPNLEETWSKLEASEMIERLRKFPPSQHFFDSSGVKRWRALEDKIAEINGLNLTEQLRLLFAKKLILAMYVPDDGPPQGILIGEAVDKETVLQAFDTWIALEPNAEVKTKNHQGKRYKQKKKNPNSPDSLYFASSEQWFAISDHESLIVDVIDRFRASIGKGPPQALANSLRRSPSFQRNRDRLKRTGAAAYLHIGARPWDRTVQEVSAGTDWAVDPAAIWSQVSFVSACLQFDQGVVCDTVIDLDLSHLPGGWSKLVSTRTREPAWNRRVPSEALMAVGGHLELAPFIRYVLKQVDPRQQTTDIARSEVDNQCRLIRRELFEVVLPGLARDFCGFMVTRDDPVQKRVTLDGVISFSLNAANDKQIVDDFNRGFECALDTFAERFSSKVNDKIRVNHEESGSLQSYWLSGSVPIPLAFGLKGQDLVVAGSRDRLMQAFDMPKKSDNPARLSEHATRYFPHAEQLVWFDIVRIRNLLKTNGCDVVKLLSRGSEEEAKRLVTRYEQAGSVLELIDSFFVAGQLESDYIKLTFGGGLDAKAK